MLPQLISTHAVAIARDDVTIPRTDARPVGAPALFVTRGPLAARVHRLHGITPTGQARLGAAQGQLAAAFGGDLASFGQLASPWIAARSLARPVETLSSQPTSRWLLGTQRAPAHDR